MKQKILVGLLSVEALGCVLFCILQTSFAGVITAVAAFPFEQIGMGLRSLSLSSGGGNAVAVAIYAAVSLLPIAALPIMRKKRKLLAEDGLLGVLSVVIFVVLYIMINPGIINTLLNNGVAAQSVGKAIFGSMVYSVLFGYIVLRVLRLFSAGETEKLVRYLSGMLRLLSALFVYWVFGACFNGLLNSIASLQAGNVGNEHLLGASYVFLVLQFVVDALPYFFNMLVVFAALRLLGEMRSDRYSSETVAAAGQISRLCTAALVTMVLANIGFNLLQLIFIKSLMVTNSTVQIPVFSITFVLAALLLTRVITDNKQLKDDNDMFI